MEQPLYLVAAGAALGSIFNIAFYPVNLAVYRGAVLPITIEFNALMAVVGLFGALVSLAAGRRLTVLTPRIEV